MFPTRTPSIEAALRDLKSDKPGVRRSAAEALGAATDSELADEARAALIRATDDLRPDVRSAAALALGELGGRSAAQALIRCLDDGNSEVRQVAAVALGTTGETCAVPALIDKLASGPPDLRFQAATSLAEVDPDAAREPLLDRLKEDDDPEVLGAAALALGAIGEARARDPLAELLEGAEAGGKRAKHHFDLAYGLADLGDERAVSALAGHLTSPDNGWDAIVALEKIGSAGASSALVRFAEESSRRFSRVDQRLAIRAAAAMLRVADGNADGTDRHAVDACRQLLLSALGARKLEHRGLAVELLADVGGPWAIAPLERLLGRWAGRRLREEIEETLAALRTISGGTKT